MSFTATDQMINTYEINRVLKETIFGNICHAIVLNSSVDGILTRSNVTRAVKIYQKEKMREYVGRTEENPRQEITVLQLLASSGGHVNVIEAFECVTDDDHIYLVLEFCDGFELYDMIEARGRLDDSVARFFFRQICSGLKYLHSLGIAHRDISLENVMVSKLGICKFIDFGMCVVVQQQTLSTGQVVSQMVPQMMICGKKNYIAPEVIRKTTPINPLLADNWGLGVELFIMLTGVPPFDAAIDMDARFKMIVQGRLAELLQQWQIPVDSRAIDLLNHLFKLNPWERPSFEEIMAHPWMNLPDCPRFGEALDTLNRRQQFVHNFPPIIHGKS